MEPRVSLITLGVADVQRAEAFYRCLGWVGQEAEETVFIQVGGLALVLWSRAKLALDCGLADVVLIDNFDVTSMKKAVAMVTGRLVIEASGGITLDTIAEIAATGVDYASSGALTHSAPALDVGLDIEI